MVTMWLFGFAIAACGVALAWSAWKDNKQPSLGDQFFDQLAEERREMQHARPHRHIEVDKRVRARRLIAERLKREREAGGPVGHRVLEL